MIVAFSSYSMSDTAGHQKLQKMHSLDSFLDAEEDVVVGFAVLPQMLDPPLRYYDRPIPKPRASCVGKVSSDVVGRQRKVRQRLGSRKSGRFERGDIREGRKRFECSRREGRVGLRLRAERWRQNGEKVVGGNLLDTLFNARSKICLGY